MKRLTFRFDTPETDKLIEQLKSEGIAVETKIEPDEFDRESDLIAIYVNGNDYQEAFHILDAFEQTEEESAKE